MQPFQTFMVSAVYDGGAGPGGGAGAHEQRDEGSGAAERRGARPAHDWERQREHRRAGLLRVDWVSLGAPLGHAREPKAYEGERFFRDAAFAAAFLAAKRRSSVESGLKEVEVPVVYDSRGPIAFGSPCDWASGVASRVLSHELRLATVHFKKEEALDAGISVEIPLYAIENAGKIFLDYKAQTAQGGRQTQEDRYMCEPDMDKNSAAYPKLCKIGLPTLSFFAVYDGHGGEAAAEYLREKLHKSFADALGDQAHVNRAAPRGRRSRVCIKAAIRDAFKELVIAHVGDCRAVLASKDGTVNVLTKDHTFFNHEERERVKQEGGRWDQERVNGYLEISRAFGNVDLSHSDASKHHKHHGVSAEPEVMQVTVAEHHELLLLASDGMWSGNNNANFGFRTGEEVVKHLRQRLRCNNNNLEEALKSAVDKAIQGNDQDNCTAVLVAFHKLEQDAAESFKPITFPKERPKFFNSNKSIGAGACGAGEARGGGGAGGGGGGGGGAGTSERNTAKSPPKSSRGSPKTKFKSPTSSPPTSSLFASPPSIASGSRLLQGSSASGAS